jgi:lambda repressor-like predicted transcriptional regulator
MEVILVHCERGEGELRRNVMQVWSKAGVLIAEHDGIHPDPVWPACFARDQIAAGKWAMPAEEGP